VGSDARAIWAGAVEGPGIAADQRLRVLEPFVRLEGSRNRRTCGAGLGLTIARKTAELHGGSLELGDAPGGGTRAVVKLPLFQRRRLGRSSADPTRGLRWKV